jgi:hypothetical protein
LIANGSEEEIIHAKDILSRTMSENLEHHQAKEPQLTAAM